MQRKLYVKEWAEKADGDMLRGVVKVEAGKHDLEIYAGKIGRWWSK